MAPPKHASFTEIADQIADLLNLPALSVAAWKESVSDVNGGVSSSRTQAALAAALAAKAERIAFVARLPTVTGSAPCAIVGRPAYKELSAAVKSVKVPLALPMHMPIHLEGATGTYGEGNHLVILFPPGSNRGHGPRVSFEILDSWYIRIAKAVNFLEYVADGEVSVLLADLREPLFLAEIVVKSIVSHEAGHRNSVWPIWPAEAPWVKRARSDPTLRICLNAFGDLAADAFGPLSQNRHVQLVTLCYQLDNLLRGSPHTDADHFGGALYVRNVLNGHPLRKGALTLAQLDHGVLAIRATVEEAAANLREARPEALHAYVGVSNPVGYQSTATAIKDVRFDSTITARHDLLEALTHLIERAP